MTDLFREPEKQKFKLKEIGPWVRCSCGLSQADWKLVHGVKYAVRLERVEGEWKCQWCKDES